MRPEFGQARHPLVLKNATTIRTGTAKQPPDHTAPAPSPKPPPKFLTIRQTALYQPKFDTPLIRQKMRPQCGPAQSPLIAKFTKGFSQDQILEGFVDPLLNGVGFGAGNSIG